MFFILQPALIVATLGSLFGFWMVTGVDTVTAKIMAGLAVSLVIALVATGRSERSTNDSEHSIKDSVSPI